MINSNDAVTDVLPCAMLPGANDTLVVFKTGATELQDKLPIHMNTTIRCYPDYMIYSDLAETFEVSAIFDALADVNDNIKLEHNDFELYRRLQQHSGRAVLTQAELSGATVSVHSVSGNTENPGWKLDKWKFLPMMRRTLQEHPDKQWYVFLETDTFVFFETLLAYLSVLDPTKPYYMASAALIGDEEFAHGASGYLVSRPALQAVVKQYTENQIKWETITDGHWAGYCVLGKAFKAAGIPLTRGWPIWQGDHVGNMNYGHTDSGHSQWCHPTVSYHHLGASAIEDLWNFERVWASSSKHASSPLPMTLQIADQ